jgi:hypothetical protein
MFVELRDGGAVDTVICRGLSNDHLYTREQKKLHPTTILSKL